MIVGGELAVITIIFILWLISELTKENERNKIEHESKRLVASDVIIIFFRSFSLVFCICVSHTSRPRATATKRGTEWEWELQVGEKKTQQPEQKERQKFFRFSRVLKFIVVWRHVRVVVFLHSCAFSCIYSFILLRFWSCCCFYMCLFKFDCLNFK